MNTQNTPAQTEQETPSLKDLIGFDIPRLTRHYSDTIAYTVDCDKEELVALKTAAFMAKSILSDGVQAISCLLLTIDMDCPDSGDKRSRIHALALVYELMGALRSIDDMECVLGQAQAVIKGDVK